jgi:DNA-binding GntR family transcriptional regulator
MGANDKTEAGKATLPRNDVLDAVLLARIAPGSVMTLKEFAVRSRATIPEAEAAVAILADMGIVSVEGDRLAIAPCEKDAVLSHLGRRRELEIKLVRAAALKASDRQLEEMLASQALQRRCALVGDMDGLMVSERQLEALLIAASGLAEEGAELSRIKVEFRRSWCAANRLKTFSNVADIRTTLVKAIAARDADGAEAQIQVFFDHLLRSY